VGRYDQHRRRHPRDGKQTLQCPTDTCTTRCITTTTNSSYSSLRNHSSFVASSFFTYTYVPSTTTIIRATPIRIGGTKKTRVNSMYIYSAYILLHKKLYLTNIYPMPLLLRIGQHQEGRTPGARASAGARSGTTAIYMYTYITYSFVYVI